MESARDRKTMEIVEAEDLWLLPEVDTYGYICRGCKLDVFPASYQKTNLQRPHFRSARGKDHFEGCDIEGEKKTVSKGRTGSVRKELETSAALSPARLKLRNERTVVDVDLPPSAAQTISVSKSRSGDVGEERPKGRRSANSIRPICRAFIDFPYDRDLSLEVPGIDDTTYQYAFKKLRGEGIETFTRAKIFYAELHWSKPEEEGDYLYINLSAGEWVKDPPKLVRPYRIRVCREGWSKAKRTVVRNEIDVLREEGIEAKKKNSKERPWVFFIGEQDEKDPAIFNVTDHRLVCGLLGTITYPKR
ncbi:hypothetical protein [Pseudomonas sp. A34-9]|uniref:hypothetical protein n=1 Tax=Pseudomonas sp. A34-9 TaxID=3034675 RepID=UPI00240DBE8E|nr:hypothetical protein [Pseudomonas sp. A34-9]